MAIPVFLYLDLAHFPRLPATVCSSHTFKHSFYQPHVTDFLDHSTEFQHQIFQKNIYILIHHTHQTPTIFYIYLYLIEKHLQRKIVVEPILSYTAQHTIVRNEVTKKKIVKKITTSLFTRKQQVYKCSRFEHHSIIR